jgi:dolichol-phosphate mannosyltransferase
LPQKKKKGLGAAYLAGMKRAFSSMKADVIITMDGDLSHNPEEIPAFLEKISQGHDFVIGSRYIAGGAIPENWPVHRKILSTIGNIIVINLLGLKSLTDWTSGFRAIKKEVYETVLLKIKEDKAEYRGYTFNIGFAYHTVMAGFSVSETPIKFTERTSGKSKLGLEYLLHAPMFLIKTRLSNTLKSILKKVTP